MTRRRLPAGPPVPAIDVAGAIDALRQLLGLADALTRATEALLESGPWGADADADRRRLDGLAHLLGAATEAVRDARLAGDQIAAELADGRAAT